MLEIYGYLEDYLQELDMIEQNSLNRFNINVIVKLIRTFSPKQDSVSDK